MNGITTKISNTLATYGAAGNLNYVGNGNKNDIEGAVTGIVNAVIGVLAIVCVIVIIVGGINYMTSAGDSGKVKTAKNTILYGLIGLVICVLAFAIVNWLIGILK